MKRFVLIITAIIILSNWGLLMGQVQTTGSAGDSGIRFFEGTWEETLAEAAKEDKLIFLDVYATWCAPCKLLKSKTFPDPEAGKYFNEHFINVSFDGEKGEGLTLARMLKISAYPSLFILNKDGEPIVHYAGFLQPEDLILLGKAGQENR